MSFNPLDDKIPLKNLNMDKQKSIEMEKKWNHLEKEGEIYKKWETAKAFTPKIDPSKKPYTIIMPPPNANDPLHIGHARFVAIEDIITRYKRMRGIPTLWLPGADHAGIETQYVFEKKLAKEKKSRFDYKREELYKMIWDYVQKNKKLMESQLKTLGASCDWTRDKFTLDPKIIKIIYKTFKKLYDEDLIYRGNRIVNYCPRCGTAFSQLEVNYLERDDNFYYLDYGTLTIATTRPETIFADTAIAVNLKDKRYKKLIGKMATIPIINRNIPIITDELVDPEFGTGVLKVTPGHDPTDFEIGQKHKLKTISVINKKGRMINTPKKYLGMTVKKAREEVVKDLEKAGKLKKTEKIHHTVGTCYRDKGILEPLLSEQWFIKIQEPPASGKSKGLAKETLTAIKNGKVKFTAKRYEKIAKHWLRNLKDWNISRQIIWGIRIPAWKCQSCKKWTITDGTKPEKCPFCKSTKLIQDKDTFDTWFSSGQWPFATLQTTNKGDFKYFYPTSLMETAYDILPFWVIRMIMLGIYETGDVPFKEVLIHGLIRDKNGQKISKSKGNVIDPIEMSEKYGTDALRMGTVWGALVENDISLSEDKIRGQRNFSNKIWNIARFVLFQNQTKEEEKKIEKTKKTKNINMENIKLNIDDRWILSELNKTTERVTKLMEEYKLSQAAKEIYQFIWHKFADIYLEKSKKDRIKSQPILEYLLLSSIKLLHPFMPFVTEAIYQIGFSKDNNDLLITSSWPENKRSFG